ncbi:MAG: metallophosphoesterase family protein [Hamadaea sp.]|nr:metallophosphoesterase family protein [Hamadaea sp.]NUT08345.1 metallophosphoesterase family protein [Hamadaea sp.]
MPVTRHHRGMTPRYGPVRRVAVLADVHGNVPALRAVLAEPDVQAADLVVFPGDVTWGPEPQLTVDLIRALGDRAVCVRGNADRAVYELARQGREPAGERDVWMPRQHSAEAIDFLETFPFTVVVGVEGLGDVRFCHGSPRKDTECVTPETPEDRYADLSAGVPEQVIVTGHTHLQFDRAVAGRRSVNSGSVGLPYHLGEPGTAYWALLGPDIELRSTRYDVQAAIQACVDSGDPRADVITGYLLTPPAPAEVTAHAEGLVFSD